MTIQLKEIAQQKGVSLKYISETTQTGSVTLSKIANGKSNPTLDTLKKIAEALEVTVSQLIGEEPVSGLVITSGSVPEHAIPLPAIDPMSAIDWIPLPAIDPMSAIDWSDKFIQCPYCGHRIELGDIAINTKAAKHASAPDVGKPVTKEADDVPVLRLLSADNGTHTAMDAEKPVNPSSTEKDNADGTDKSPFCLQYPDVPEALPLSVGLPCCGTPEYDKTPVYLPPAPIGLGNIQDCVDFIMERLGPYNGIWRKVQAVSETYEPYSTTELKAICGEMERTGPPDLEGRNPGLNDESTAEEREAAVKWMVYNVIGIIRDEIDDSAYEQALNDAEYTADEHRKAAPERTFSSIESLHGKRIDAAVFYDAILRFYYDTNEGYMRVHTDIIELLAAFNFRCEAYTDVEGEKRYCVVIDTDGIRNILARKQLEFKPLTPEEKLGMNETLISDAYSKAMNGPMLDFMASDNPDEGEANLYKHYSDVECLAMMVMKTFREVGIPHQRVRGPFMKFHWEKIKARFDGYLGSESRVTMDEVVECLNWNYVPNWDGWDIPRMYDRFVYPYRIEKINKLLGQESDLMSDAYVYLTEETPLRGHGAEEHWKRYMGDEFVPTAEDLALSREKSRKRGGIFIDRDREIGSDGIV